MISFKMVNDDYVLDDYKNLVLISGDDEIRQSIERRVTTNIREWFLNIGFGLDYEAIQGKDKTKEGIELALRQCIFEDTRVTDITFNEIDLNRGTRHLIVNLNVVVGDEVIDGIEVNL